jgi:hypothetical protein
VELVEVCSCCFFDFHRISDYTMANHMFLLILDSIKG